MSRKSNVKNVKCQQFQMSTMSNVKMSTVKISECCDLHRSVEICSDLLRSPQICQDLPRPIKISPDQSRSPQINQDVNQIVKLSTMSNCPNVQMSWCQQCQQYQIVKLLNCQIVNQIVKLSKYQMSCIIRVCRLT